MTLEQALNEARPTGRLQRFKDAQQPGLYLRMSAKGKRVYIVRIGSDGKDRTIGKPETMSLDEARAAAREMRTPAALPDFAARTPLAQTRRGSPSRAVVAEHEPDELPDIARQLTALIGELRADLAARDETIAMLHKTIETLANRPATAQADDEPACTVTMGEAIDAFLADMEDKVRHGGRAPNTLADHRQHLVKVLPLLGDKPLASVSRSDIKAAVSGMSDSVHNHTVRSLRRVFNWAASEHEWLPRAANPCTAFELRREKARKRIMREGEPALIWKALEVAEQCGESRAALDAIRFLIFEPRRIGEGCRIRWADVDLENGTLTIPADNSKSGEEKVVALSKQGRALIAARERVNEWVFTNGARARHKPVGKSSVRKLFKQCCTAAGIEERIVPHDLRRTVATHIGDMTGDAFAVRDALTHANTDMASRYKTVVPSRQLEVSEDVGDLMEKRIQGDIAAPGG